jgi:predicted nucleic-acid-binding Zn-ribbon protein
MPIKDGKRYCINHPNARMNRTETLKALVNMTGGAIDGTINPNSGLVVMPFVCEECGYLELYVADKTQKEKK